MPIYEYLCKDCGNRFEQIKPMSTADEKISCPKCASLEVRRLISVVNAFSGGKISRFFDPVPAAAVLIAAPVDEHERN